MTWKVTDTVLFAKAVVSFSLICRFCLCGPSIKNVCMKGRCVRQNVDKSRQEYGVSAYVNVHNVAL